MRADGAQRQIKRLLVRVFSAKDVKSEWNIRKDSSDWASDIDVYAPRPDIAVGPFNLSRADARREFQAIDASANCDLIAAIADAVMKQNDGWYVRNRNPRCLLAIEIEFNGSSKHVLGSIANASMLGLFGVVIGSPEYITKVQRIGAYARSLRQVRKAPPTLFGNVAYFEVKEFVKLLKAHL